MTPNPDLSARRADPPVLAILAALALGLLLLLGGCSVAPGGDPSRPVQGLNLHPDLPVAQAPFDHLEANWKHRLAQPYAYLEARGSYTGIGALLSELVAQAGRQGLAISGPPFALYYDDPGSVPVDELRMRACLPLEGPASLAAPLAYGVLPSTTVVYAFVAGPYPEVPRAYAPMYRYMSELGWRENGPVRESYLVNPADVTDFAQLITEVQVPAISSR